MECSNCGKDLENDPEALTDDNDRCYCNNDCYRAYVSGWEDYIQTLGGD